MLLVKKDAFQLIAMLYFKFDRERDYGMGPQGLGRVHLGVCPQVYLHLLYLECKNIEHSWAYVWDNLNHMG